MKVILIEDVKGTGKKGQIIETSDGHARNFLIPRKLGIEATKENIAAAEQRKKHDEKKRIEELEKFRALKIELESKKIKIPVKTGGSGKLFGSVTNKEVAAELEKQTGLVIDRKKIIMDEAVKNLGEKQVEIRLHTDVTAKLTLEIVEA